MTGDDLAVCVLELDAHDDPGRALRVEREDLQYLEAVEGDVLLLPADPVAWYGVAELLSWARDNLGGTVLGERIVRFLSDADRGGTVRVSLPWTAVPMPWQTVYDRDEVIALVSLLADDELAARYAPELDDGGVQIAAETGMGKLVARGIVAVDGDALSLLADHERCIRSWLTPDAVVRAVRVLGGVGPDRGVARVIDLVVASEEAILVEDGPDGGVALRSLAHDAALLDLCLQVDEPAEEPVVRPVGEPGAIVASWRMLGVVRGDPAIEFGFACYQDDADRWWVRTDEGDHLVDLLTIADLLADGLERASGTVGLATRG